MRWTFALLLAAIGVATAVTAARQFSNSSPAVAQPGGW